MILTSETIYSAENYQCLHDTIKALLKPEGTTYPFNNSAEGPQTSIIELRTLKRTGFSEPAYFMDFSSDMVLGLPTGEKSLEDALCPKGVDK